MNIKLQFLIKLFTAHNFFLLRKATSSTRFCFPVACCSPNLRMKCHKAPFERGVNTHTVSRRFAVCEDFCPNSISPCDKITKLASTAEAAAASPIVHYSAVSHRCKLFRRVMSFSYSEPGTHFPNQQIAKCAARHKHICCTRADKSSVLPLCSLFAGTADRVWRNMGANRGRANSLCICSNALITFTVPRPLLAHAPILNSLYLNCYPGY